MTNAEKEIIRNMALGMEKYEKEFMIMFFPTEILQAELLRREEKVNAKLLTLCGIINQVTSDMLMSEKEDVLNNVIEMVRKKDTHI